MYEIELETTKKSVISLIVNDAIKARHNGKIPSNADTPIMKTIIKVDKKEEALEVYALPGFFKKTKICVNGRRIAGDDF